MHDHGYWVGHIVPIAATTQLSRAGWVGEGAGSSTAVVDSPLQHRTGEPARCVTWFLTIEADKARNTHDQDVKGQCFFFHQEPPLSIQGYVTNRDLHAEEL